MVPALQIRAIMRICREQIAMSQPGAVVDSENTTEKNKREWNKQLEFLLEQCAYQLNSMLDLIKLSLKYSQAWNALFTASEATKALPIIQLVLGGILSAITIKQILLGEKEKTAKDYLLVSLLLASTALSAISVFMFGLQNTGAAIGLAASSISMIASIIKMVSYINQYINETDPDRKVSLIQSMVSQGLSITKAIASLVLSISFFTPIGWPVVIALASFVAAVTIGMMIWKLIPAEQKQRIKSFVGLTKSTYESQPPEKDTETKSKDSEVIVGTSSPLPPSQTETKPPAATPWPKKKANKQGGRMSLMFFTPHPSKEQFKEMKQKYQNASLEQASEINVGPRPNL